MPVVTFMPSGKMIEVASGTTLFEAATRAGLPVASSCSAENVCGKCNMQIIQGADSLSNQSEYEKKLLQRERHAVTDRISCLTKIEEDCVVTTKYW